MPATNDRWEMHCFFFVTHGQVIVQVSSSFPDVTGISSEAIIGQNVAEFLGLGPEEQSLLQERKYGSADLHLTTTAKTSCALLLEVTFEPLEHGQGMLVLCLPRSLKQRHSPALSVWTCYNEIQSPLYINRISRGAASAPPASKRPPNSESRPDNRAFCLPRKAL